MKVIKKLLGIFVIIVIFPKTLLSDFINKEDIKLLNANDEKIFIKKCFINDTFIDTSKCLNFLVIKIFINNFINKPIKKYDKGYIEEISIRYLKLAAKEGYKKAYINLGWIYSYQLSKSQDLNKSSEYFKLFENSKLTNLNDLEINLGKKNLVSINRKKIVLAVLIMEKLNLYNSNSKDESKSYLSFREYEKGKRAYVKIIEFSKLSSIEIQELIKVVLKDNSSILSNLDKQLSVFEKKYRRNALKDLRALINIHEELN